MAKLITIAVGAVNAKLVNATREECLAVQLMLSYAEDGAAFSAAHQSGTWDGRSSFFAFSTAMFPAGFFVRVYREFVRLGYQVNVVRRDLPAPIGEKNAKVDDFGFDARYDYQPQVVDLLERYGQVIAQVATGGGKSRIAKLSVMRVKRPTLFLTTRGILMHQMRDAFQADLGLKVGIYGDSEWSPTLQLFNVGMVQTFSARLEEKTIRGELESLAQRRQVAEDKKIESPIRALKKKKVHPDTIGAEVGALLLRIRSEYPPAAQTLDETKTKVELHMRKRTEAIDLLARFEFVILEEAHEASSNSYSSVMRHCTGAHYRLSLTATPGMKDSQKANMMLEAASGPVAIKVSEKMLIDRGILAKPYFVFATDPDPFPTGEYEAEVIDEHGDKTYSTKVAKLHKSTPYVRAVELGITGSITRNARIVAEVKRAHQHGLSSMVLVQRSAHGKRLAELLHNAGVRCAWIEGEDNQDTRQAAIQALKSGEISCLIGSTILDVGVDVPAVGLVVLAGGGKAEVANRQRIGRGLRAKRSGPNICFVLDFEDRHNNHLRDHARERRRLVDSTPGFSEGVVADFPYAQLFALKAAA